MSFQQLVAQSNSFYIEHNNIKSRTFFDTELDKYYSNNGNGQTLFYRNNEPRNFYNSFTVTFGYSRNLKSMRIGIWARLISKGQKSNFNFVLLPSSVNEIYGGYSFVVKQESIELGMKFSKSIYKSNYFDLEFGVSPFLESYIKQTATYFFLNGQTGEVVLGGSQGSHLNPGRSTKMGNALANLKSGRFRIGSALELKVLFITKWKFISPFIKLESSGSSRLLNLQEKNKSFLPDGYIFTYNYSLGINLNF